MLLKLRVTEGSNAGKEIVVNKDKFLIGRADDCNLRPHSDAISRHHCVIVQSEKGVGIRDLKSRNGTIVNGTKITGDKRLRNGDTLIVGPLKFEIVLVDAPVSTTPSAAKISEGEIKPALTESIPVAGCMGGMVSQWLEEADDVAREEQRLTAPTETREYRFDETSTIALETAAVEAGKDDKGKGKKKQEEQVKLEPGKLPKFEVKQDKPKDTHEAASQVLRKLFNRGS